MRYIYFLVRAPQEITFLFLHEAKKSRVPWFWSFYKLNAGRKLERIFFFFLYSIVENFIELPFALWHRFRFESNLRIKVKWCAFLTFIVRSVQFSYFIFHLANRNGISSFPSSSSSLAFFSSSPTLYFSNPDLVSLILSFTMLWKNFMESRPKVFATAVEQRTRYVVVVVATQSVVRAETEAKWRKKCVTDLRIFVSP